MLYTGHWFRKYPADVEVVRISAGVPKGKRYALHVQALTPTWWMVRKATKEQYNERFARMLDEAAENGTIATLLEQARNHDVVLVCWERDRNHCHRKQVAEFIEERFGVEVPEWGEKPSVEPEPEEDATDQLELFG